MIVSPSRCRNIHWTDLVPIDAAFAALAKFFALPEDVKVSRFPSRDLNSIDILSCR